MLKYTHEVLKSHLCPKYGNWKPSCTKANSRTSGLPLSPPWGCFVFFSLVHPAACLSFSGMWSDSGNLINHTCAVHHLHALNFFPVFRTILSLTSFFLGGRKEGKQDRENGQTVEGGDDGGEKEAPEECACKVRGHGREREQSCPITQVALQGRNSMSLQSQFHPARTSGFPA